MGKANLCALLNFSLNEKLNRQGKPANYENYLTVISMTSAAEKILTCLNKRKNTTILQVQCISIRNQ